jgi:serine/threonine-protein kinase
MSEPDDSKKVVINPREPRMDFATRLLLQEQIGEGGMSIVHEARDTNLLRTSAVKVVHPELLLDVHTRRRMIEEAQITAQLEHPNILPVHELGVTDDGALFFTMKRVEGQTLGEILRRSDVARRPEQELVAQLEIFVKVCQAVAFAHSRGVIHRDLKPDNVMVGDYGEVYLMDWGLARLQHRPRPTDLDLVESRPKRYQYRSQTQDGRYVGTPSYMAPEQAVGDHQATDERSDVFSLGAILYEVLTGVAPYRGHSPLEVLMQAVEGIPPPPQAVVDFPLPPRLCRVAVRAMSREPFQRYQSALELQQSVVDFLHSGWLFPTRIYPAGSLIVREGEQGEEAFVMVHGECLVFRIRNGRREALARLNAGDVFGETAVFSDLPHGASVVAADEVTVRVVTREHLTEEMGPGPDLGRFLKALARTFDERNSRAAELERLLRRERLAGEVLRRLCRARQTGDPRRDGLSWSSLRRELAQKFRCREADVEGLLGSEAGLEIDVVQDRVRLREG